VALRKVDRSQPVEAANVVDAASGARPTPAAHTTKHGNAQTPEVAAETLVEFRVVDEHRGVRSFVRANRDEPRVRSEDGWKAVHHLGDSHDRRSRAPGTRCTPARAARIASHAKARRPLPGQHAGDPGCHSVPDGSPATTRTLRGLS